MKKLFAILLLSLLGQQSYATSVAGIEFLDIGDTLDSFSGTFISNSNSGAPQNSIVDGNGASYVNGTSSSANLDVFFGDSLNRREHDVADVDLSILFVGNGYHFGTVTLLGGTSDSTSMNFLIEPGENYTGWNSVQEVPPTADEDAEPTIWGVYSDTLDLSSVFTGTFSGVRLEIGTSLDGNPNTYSASPSLLGVVVAPVPVPAAVWLFGSGLLGLVAAARRRRS